MCNPVGMNIPVDPPLRTAGLGEGIRLFFIELDCFIKYVCCFWIEC